MSKYRQLQQAYQQQQLIDVIMRATNDIYTGKVCQLDPHHVLMQVYNDYGLLNGYVIVTIRAIALVNTSSGDLQRIKQRIFLAQEQKLLGAPPLILPHFSDQNLLTAVLQYLCKQRQVALFVGITQYHYQQAQIINVKAKQLQLSLMDFFDFSDKEVVRTFLQSQLEAVEFGGQELEQATSFFALQPQHTLPVIVKANQYLETLLKPLLGSSTLLMVYVNISHNNFYVGQVINVTADTVVLSLVDQDGRFGGYALIRLDAIKFVSAQTDYLKMINVYRTWHQKAHTFVQPVLNDQMKFSVMDFWQNTFEQLTQLQLIIRIQLRQLDTDFLAYSVAAKATSVQLAIFDDLQAGTTQIHEFKYQDLERVAFGYLNSYFTKTELIK